MKKILVLFITVCITAVGLTACGEKNSDNVKYETETGKISIVATIFPAYDWVKQITDGSENIDLTLLFDSGADLHNYQSTADDVIKISNCDMFIYVGGESDDWVDDTLAQAANEDMIVINLLEALGDGVKIEEHKEGMEEEEHEDGEEAEEFDEHIWLSLKNAEILCNYITEQLSAIDSINADLYSSNKDNYISSVSDLDEKYQKAVDNAQNKTLLFGDRFPFKYLVDDYGLDYYAAFSGCCAETEASFETIMYLAGKVDELGLKYVITIEGTTHNIARTIIDNTSEKNQEILTLDSMQSKTLSNVNNGETYLSVMENNLSVLRQALA